MENEELGFKDILKHIDRESEHFVIRLETHSSGRGSTTVEPHRLTRDDAELDRLANDLREALGIGGGVERGRIVLQGDQRERVKDELLRLGFRLENIEIIEQA